MQKEIHWLKTELDPSITSSEKKDLAFRFVGHVLDAMIENNCFRSYQIKTEDPGNNPYAEHLPYYELNFKGKQFLLFVPEDMNKFQKIAGSMEWDKVVLLIFDGHKVMEPKDIVWSINQKLNRAFETRKLNAGFKKGF